MESPYPASPSNNDKVLKPASAHKEFVTIWAKAYKDTGWTVQADIRGFLTPSKIKRAVPELYAKKGNSVRVLEFVNDASKNSAHTRAQVSNFKKWAEESPNRKFKLILANSYGSKEVT